MAKAKTTEHPLIHGGVTPDPKAERISVGEMLSKKASFRYFEIWLVGDTPLIVHAWSEKARREMLSKQVKAAKIGKEARDPQQDFVDSLYEMGPDTFGFPVSGIKNSIWSSAHKDKGVAKTEVIAGLWLDGEMVRTRPALAGSVCDMPLVRIHGSKPEMREDMVRIGSGPSKTASLAYRGQFTAWAIKLTGRVTDNVLSAANLGFLINEAGRSVGLGEWRNEKKGMFGAFHLGNVVEQEAWEKFSSGRGPLPVRSNLAEAAD